MLPINVGRKSWRDRMHLAVCLDFSRYSVHPGDKELGMSRAPVNKCDAGARAIKATGARHEDTRGRFT